MVMRWPGIQSAIDILKSTRLRVENVVNEGCVLKKKKLYN